MRRITKQKTRRKISHGLKKYHKSHRKSLHPLRSYKNSRSTRSAKALFKAIVAPKIPHTHYEMPYDENWKTKALYTGIITAIILGTIVFVDLALHDKLF